MKYKKSKYKISAKLIKKGSCPYYEEGLTFQLTGFTPNGLCDSAYAVISRDTLALRYGADLPWKKDDDTIHTHCPDSVGAVWEIKRVLRPARPVRTGTGGQRLSGGSRSDRHSGGVE